jgi:hypothetical protein
MNINDNKIIIVGEKYRGEVLIVDFGIEGVEEDSWYKIGVNGEIVKVE